MTTILGRLFGLYAIYRAWVGRPIKGRRRPRGFDAGWITSGAITASKISANAVTSSMVSADSMSCTTSPTVAYWSAG
jgi:hypothetical protein